MRSILFFILFAMTLFSSEIKLTDKQANYIAKKVWQNEGAGLDKYLVHWNDGEDFASVGIGHFIWFSKGHTERFREVLYRGTLKLNFMQQKKHILKNIQSYLLFSSLPCHTKQSLWHNVLAKHSLKCWKL